MSVEDRPMYGPGCSSRISDAQAHPHHHHHSQHDPHSLIPHQQHNHPHKKKKHKRKPTFNLEPEYIPPGPSGDCESPQVEMNEQEAAEYEAKESHRKRVKRIVAGVGITLTVICVVLVGLSLAFGQKIDDMVGTKRSSSDSHEYDGKTNEFYLGPTPKPTNATNT